MAGENDASEEPADTCVLLIGEGSLADATERALQRSGAAVARLREPDDDGIREGLERDDVDSVVIVSKDDHLSLRLALVVENLRPGVPLIATVHGRIVAAQLQRVVENARALSRADVAAPALAAACFEEDLLFVRPEGDDGFLGVYAGDEKRELRPVEASRQGFAERMLANVGSLINPFEVSARILMAGLAGFLLVLLIDAVATGITLHESPIDAFYAATKTIVTVGPNQDVDKGPAWFKVFSSLAMIAALAFTAIFTAGVVDRLLDRRLTAMVGSRSVPRKDHVIVVGLGNVGLRLCLLLRDLGVRVLAIESSGDNYNVARAKDYGIPVVLGRGGSHFLLRRLSLRRARALAAVTSDEVENISIVGAALGIREDLRILLRAGRGEVTNETQSLFKLGIVRDVNRIGGAFLAAAALGSEAGEAYLDEETVYLTMPDGKIEPFHDENQEEREEGDPGGDDARGAEPGDE
ncbi:MAG: NAD-binding protein [Actinomycetota bacterium]|nr:NAD-binding protein [Actinomycetota bacterium]